MAGENDFVPFATASGANVESQASYVADSSRTAGEVNGIANAQRANKAWRQGTFMAAMIGAFISSQEFGGTYLTAIDDGNVANLLTSFEDALQIWLANNFLSVTPNPAGSLPFAFTLPGGYILQFGASSNMGNTTTSLQVPLAIPWPNGYLWGHAADGGTYGWVFALAAGADNSHVNLICNKNQLTPDSFGGAGTTGAARLGNSTNGWWFAIGH
jgi:hypothetical protein